MDILFLLIPLSVVLAIAIGVAFWLAVDGGQFDDLEAPALRVLADDDRPPPDQADTDPQQGRL
jgi:cbb3-type cytochrome oxidase maturation protein